jgi:hypothetical protein
MSNLMKNVATATFVLTSALALAACDVDQTQEGALPDVEVTAEGGQLPAYDVETAEVEVKTETVPVEVPKIEVEMPNDPDSKVTDETDSAAKD